MRYGVEPDMAWFGKALGNGYAISAIIGKADVMSHAQDSFISSTFWTERIGSAAALKTIEIMQRDSVPELLVKKGKSISKRWLEIGKKHGLSIDVFGLPTLAHYTFNSKDELKYKTFITQEMLKNSFLATTAIYVSLAHTDELIEDYFRYLDPIFEKISKCELGELDINELIEGPVCHSGFRPARSRQPAAMMRGHGKAGRMTAVLHARPWR